MKEIKREGYEVKDEGYKVEYNVDKILTFLGFELQGLWSGIHPPFLPSIQFPLKGGRFWLFSFDFSFLTTLKEYKVSE